MRANILLIEYERRSVDQIRRALAETEHTLEVAGDLHRAVEICAHFEPRLVIITAELPGVSVGDAITQLRARAGLRATPFLIMMAGYLGEDGEVDAAQLGAQDILARPYGSQALVEKVERLVRLDAGARATQAIPPETLAALRRGAGGGAASLTSDDLFGDILSDVEGDEQPAAAAPSASAPPAPPPPAKPAKSDKLGVDEALAEALGMKAAKGPLPRKPAPAERDVDAMLSETLAGLDIQLAGAKAARRPKAEAPASVPPSAPAAAPSPPPVPAPPSEPEPMPDLEPVAEPGPVQPPLPEPVEAVPPPAGTRFGQYILEERVAKGGMAEVFRARMMGVEGFQKTVAIKRILADMAGNDEFVTMFIDEAKLAAQLKHPNIVDIYDLGKIDRSFYIAMEYVEGHDLREVLGRCRSSDVTVPVPLALHCAAQLASALDHAHTTRDFEKRDLGLVHRDVSPPNVLISNDGEVKLCDFGIAKALTKATHTRDGLLKGKLRYMSPEQASGREIDHRSDIFSLGLVLYEMLTGKKVFDGATEAEILKQARNPWVGAPSTANPEVPPDVDRIVLRALEEDPSARYQSAEAIGRALEAAIRGHGWAPDAAALAAFVRDPAAPVEVATFVPPPPVVPPPPPPRAPARPPLTPEPEPVPRLEAAAEELGSEGPFLETELAAKRQPWWLFVAGIAAVVVAVVAVVVLTRGGGGDQPVEPTPAPIVVLPPTETPVALMEEAPAEEPVAAAPAATPRPPTLTPTATETPTETPTETATPVPDAPTPTRVPPTASPASPTATFTPAVREGDLVTMGSGVVRPVLVRQVDPEYPKLAQRMGIDGEVEVEVLVGPDGAVEDVRVVNVSRTGVGFERATIDAVRQWRYKPATKGGVNVRMWVPARVRLTLR
jgi:TonB family protein